MKRVVIKSSVLTDIYPSAFLGCTSLSEVVFENTSKLEKIWESAFSNCGFTEFEVPEGVKEVGTGSLGGGNAFGNCEKLTSISFPSTLQYIAFSGKNLDSLISVVFADPNGWNKEVGSWYENETEPFDKLSSDSGKNAEIFKKSFYVLKKK